MGSKKSRILEKPSPYWGVVLDVSEPVADAAAQATEMVRGRVGERRGVQVGPERFDGIELGGIGGEPFDIQPATVPLECRAGEAAAVGGEAIPEEENRTPAMTPQGVEKAHQVGTVDTAAVEGQEPSETLGARGGEHGADSREALPIEGLAQAGGLSFGGPSRPNRRALREPALVQKRQPGLQPAGFFLIWGQRTRTQRAMAFSSRSRARRAGRWRLHPSPRRTRQTCRGW